MLDEILRYECGLMSDEDALAFEERLFTEPALRAAAARVSAVPDVLKGLARDLALIPILDEAGVATLRARARVDERVLGPGRHEAPLPEADFIVARIPARLEAARHVDVDFCTPDGTPYFSVREAPFSPGGVIVACSVEVARGTGHLRVRVRDERGELCADVELVNT